MDEDYFEYNGSYKDVLEDFFTSPTKGNFPSLLQADKEYNTLDFKAEWYEKSQLARHILAFANSGGGAIVYGVKEEDNGSLVSTGLQDPRDEADFGNKIEKYLPDDAHTLYALETYPYGDLYDESIANKTFQVVFVDGAGELAPLVSTNAGSNIDDATIYVRRNTKSVPAKYDEVQSLLNQRRESGIEKKTAELHEELRELKTLYDEIDKNITYMNGSSGMVSSITSLVRTMDIESKPNPVYPDEDYEEYISTLIDKKKARIERRLGVEGIQL